jgi:endonuclease/exonuclease/phosphatase family metal-dependent hydrolase
VARLAAALALLAALWAPSSWAPGAAAAELKIATWNLNWLTLRPAGAPGLPPDVKPRAPEDFDRLRAYAAELDADILALQEVDSAEAVRLVLPRERYALHLARDRLTQKVAIAVRAGIRHTAHPDVPLSSDPADHVRSGVDVTVETGGGALRLLAVHLKHGCRDAKQERAGGRDCRIFQNQAEPLAAWIAARKAEGAAFSVLGDFNRWMDKPDAFVERLRRAAPMIRATEGTMARCWRDEAFIDHIFLGGPARDWLRPDSLRVFRYRETGPGWQDRISDHCPVSIRLAAPG